MESGVNAGRAAIGRLEEASQAYESNILVELGADRLIKWIGVYVLTVLAVILKLIDVIGGSGLYCYPINTTSSINVQFIHYASAYCWETLFSLTNNGTCATFNDPSYNFIQEPYSLKMLIMALPYFILLQGIIFAAISAAWHVRFGSRLQGHLKFMKLLLEEIFTQIKTIPKGFYAALPYDRSSIYFDGFRKYGSSDKCKAQNLAAETEVVENNSEEDKNPPATDQPTPTNGTVPMPTARADNNARDDFIVVSENRKLKDKAATTGAEAYESTELTAMDELADSTPTDEDSQRSKDNLPLLSDAVAKRKESAKNNNDQNNEEETSNNSETLVKNLSPSQIPSCSQGAAPRSSSSLKDGSVQESDSDSNSDYDTLNFVNKFVVGRMRDQHLFSMLCSENFSSLHHLPYILSVFKLTVAWAKCPGENDPGVINMDEGILKIWCHSKNMFNVRLVLWYFWKHIVTALVSLIMVACTVAVYAAYLLDDYNASETFRCELPYENSCMLCTVRRKTEIFAVLFIDVALTSVVFFMSVITWLTTRTSEKRVTCCFFRQIGDIANIALYMAKKS